MIGLPKFYSKHRHYASLTPCMQSILYLRSSAKHAHSHLDNHIRHDWEHMWEVAALRMHLARICTANQRLHSILLMSYRHSLRAEAARHGRFQGPDPLDSESVPWHGRSCMASHDASSIRTQPRSKRTSSMRSRLQLQRREGRSVCRTVGRHTSIFRKYG